MDANHDRIVVSYPDELRPILTQATVDALLERSISV